MTLHLWIVAGPNGAGKSTIADRYFADRIPVINPDNIERALPRNSTLASRHLRAGRQAVSERAGLLFARQSFAVETTLTGHSELALMRAAIVAGYKVTLVYVGVRSVQVSIGRVTERVARGGHDVPLRDLFRRFDRSLANLSVAAALAHRVLLIDNSGERRQLVLSREAGRTKFVSSDRPGWTLGV